MTARRRTPDDAPLPAFRVEIFRGGLSGDFQAVVLPAIAGTTTLPEDTPHIATSSIFFTERTPPPVVKHFTASN